jgi:hypothetical protein
METLETVRLRVHAQMPMKYAELKELVKVRILHLNVSKTSSLVYNTPCNSFHSKYYEFVYFSPLHDRFPLHR